MQMTLDNGVGMKAAVRGAKKIFWLKGAEKVELPSEQLGEWTEFVLPTLEPYRPVFLLADESWNMEKATSDGMRPFLGTYCRPCS